MLHSCSVFRVIAKMAIVCGVLVSVGGIVGSGALSNTGRAADSPAATGEASGTWVTSVAPVNDQMLVAATADGLLLREASVCSFNPAHPEKLEPIYSHPAAVWAVDATTDGSRVASSDYRGNLGLYDVNAKQLTMHEGVFERWTPAPRRGPRAGSGRSPR